MIKKLLIIGSVVASFGVSNAFAFDIFDNNGKEAHGQCNNGHAWSGIYSSGYWTVSAVYSGKFSQSLSEAVNNACGE